MSRATRNALLTLGAMLLPLSNAMSGSPAPTTSGALLLVLPRPGTPISFDQTEEHSRKGPGEASAAGPRTTGRTFRDSAGWVRQESETRDDANHVLSSYTAIIDPTSGSSIMLLDAEKIAYRISLPIQSGNKMSFGIATEGEDSSHTWTATSEKAGTRIIDGAEFAGTRIIYTASDEPGLSKTSEFWYSDALKLTGSIKASGPKEILTVRIENLRQEEPDPSLFSVPSDYKIVDMKFPMP